MKKNRFIIGVLSIFLMASVLTACSSTQASETDASTTTDNSVIYGQISSVDDTSLTIEVGEMSESTGNAAEQPATDESATPPETAPTDGTVDTTTEATETGEAPTAPDGTTDGTQAPQGGGGMSQITLTGETKTLTITDATTIIAMAGNPDDTSSSTEGSVSDLTVGATVKITLGSDDEIATIEIMGGGGQPADAATTTTAS